MKFLAFYIGYRYTRAKRSNHFISFISLASVLGIALGMTVLITVLSVLNGFDKQIKSQLFSMVPQVTVTMPMQALSHWPKIVSDVKTNPLVQAASPFVAGKGIINSGGQINGIQLLGILPTQERQTNELHTKIINGKLSDLQANQFKIVIGQDLAFQLGVNLGDKIIVYTPATTVTLAGIIPRYKQFTVAGVFHASAATGFDQLVAYINLHDAAKLFQKHATYGLHVKLHDLYMAGQVTQQLQKLLPANFAVSNWTRSLGTLFSALSMEKTMMFIILILIVAVAAFNLVSTLVMVVNEKQADIAILRTLGAKQSTIMLTFITQGILIGFFGTLLGAIGGVVLSLNVTSLVNWIQSTFHVQLISSSVYFVNFLPSHIQMSDVFMVCGIGFLLTVIATLYPAWVAFRTQPAEALRYE